MNTKPIDITEERHGRPVPFRTRGADELVGKPLPKRDWLIPSIAIRRSITLLSGDGGVGKSLLCLQLQVAAALCTSFLGMQMPQEPINSLGFYCEDDDDEIHRRLASILKFYNAGFEDIGDRVRWISRVGEENELVTFRSQAKGQNARAAKTTLFGQLEEEIRDWGSELVIIDTVADTFGGNENYRNEVKTFINLMRRLTFPNNGSILLNAHPSKSAMADGSGFSGSTAWNGSVRQRLYFTIARKKGEESDHGPTDERELKVMKSNYGKFGESIKCVWSDGAFDEADRPSSQGTLERIEIDNKVLKAAEILVQKGTMIVAAVNSRNRLAILAPQTSLCRGMSRTTIENSLNRLMEAGKLIQVELGPKSRRQIYIRPGALRYPGEDQTGGQAFDTENDGSQEKLL